MLKFRRIYLIFLLTNNMLSWISFVAKIDFSTASKINCIFMKNWLTTFNVFHFIMCCYKLHISIFFLILRSKNKFVNSSLNISLWPILSIYSFLLLLLLKLFFYFSFFLFSYFIFCLWAKKKILYVNFLILHFISFCSTYFILYS